MSDNRSTARLELCAQDALHVLVTTKPFIPDWQILNKFGHDLSSNS